MNKLSVCILLAVWPVFCWAEGTFLDTQKKLLDALEDRTFELQYDTRQREEVMAAGFHQLFAGGLGDAALKDASNDELQVLFTAATKAMFYASNKENSRTIKRIFSALEKRGLSSNAHVKAVYEAYVSTREFDQARAVSDRYRNVGLMEIPTSIKRATDSKSSISIWEVDRAKSEMVETPFTFPRGPFFIVVASPTCNFSEKAMEEVGKVPTLKSLAAKYALFLSPQLRDFDFRRFQTWSASFPQYSFAGVNSRREWPSMREWSTPTFYFFLDGDLKASFSGWPAEGNMEKLKQGLNTIGLLRQDTTPHAAKKILQ